jgi:hypothetical protein
MAEEKKDSFLNLNITVIALVAIVAIIGVSAIALRGGAPTGSATPVVVSTSPVDEVAEENLQGNAGSTFCSTCLDQCDFPATTLLCKRCERMCGYTDPAPNPVPSTAYGLTCRGVTVPTGQLVQCRLSNGVAVSECAMYAGQTTCTTPPLAPGTGFTASVRYYRTGGYALPGQCSLQLYPQPLNPPNFAVSVQGNSQSLTCI